MENQYLVRVNGLIVDHIEVRHALVDGVPCGPLEIAIEDPALGWMTIDDNSNLWDNDLPQFVIEMRPSSSFTLLHDAREDAEDRIIQWERVSVTKLIELFESTGVIVRES